MPCGQGIATSKWVKYIFIQTHLKSKEAETNAQDNYVTI